MARHPGYYLLSALMERPGSVDKERETKFTRVFLAFRVTDGRNSDGVGDFAPRVRDRRS